MKKVVLLFLCIVLIFTVSGCSDTSEKSRIKLKNPNAEVIINYMPEVEYSNTIVRDFDKKFLFEGLDQWQSFMKDKFGVNIKVDYLPILDYDNFIMGNYLPGAIKENEISGVVKLNTTAQQNNFDKLISQDLILALDDYNLVSKLDEEIKDLYTINGKMWALPADYNPQLYARYLRKQWLENLKIEKPETLSQLYDIAKKFTYNDPDRNGKDDTNGITVSIDDAILSLKDVFYAHNCFVSYDGTGFVSYDMKSDTFEDALLTPEAENALNYIYNLKQEKLLFNENITDKNLVLQDKSHGNFNTLVSIDRPEGFELSYGITGEDTMYINSARVSSDCFVITKNTENPDDVVASLINTFYLNEEGYLAGYLGNENKDYRISGNTIETLTDNKINIMGLYIPAIYENGYVSNVESADKYYVNNMKVVREGLISDSFFLEKPLMGHNNLYEWRLFKGKHMFADFLNGKITVEDFIKSYKETMSYLEAQTKIDDMNRSIGKETLYRYR